MGQTAPFLQNFVSTFSLCTSHNNIFMHLEHKQFVLQQVFPSQGFLTLSLQPTFPLYLFGLLLSGSSPRGHCVVPGRLFPPSAKGRTRLAGSDKKEIKSWGLSLSFIAKGRSSAHNQDLILNFGSNGLYNNLHFNITISHKSSFSVGRQLCCCRCQVKYVIIHL